MSEGQERLAEAYRDAARRLFSDPDLEILEDHPVEHTDGKGAHVMARVWIPDSEIETGALTVQERIGDI